MAVEGGKGGGDASGGAYGFREGSYRIDWRSLDKEEGAIVSGSDPGRS
jgi:hypothetical protein